MRIGETPALLFGPLAVEPALQGKGIGRALLRHGLAEAKHLGHRICIVVGAPEYYGPYGFENATARGLRLPGPVETQRFQVFEMMPGALKSATGKSVRGLIRRDEGAGLKRPRGASR